MLSSAQTVIVSQGAVEGVQSPYTPTSGASVTVFRGLPYAQPPVGELRWQPPVAPASWQGA
ncbi:MAG: carboxylesterase family protein, partial [Halieaceae bacterium]|nr:carboxylesterase family protein [Halieaceae bacterium]